GDGPAPRDVAACVPAQVAGAIGGAVPADAMFGKPMVAFSAHERWDGRLWLGEVVATAGLVWLVFGLTRAGRANLTLLLVTSCIGAAYWSTSSTRCTNPAVTIVPAFTDIFAGIAPRLRTALPRRPADRRRRRSRPGRRLLRPPGRRARGRGRRPPHRAAARHSRLFLRRKRPGLMIPSPVPCVLFVCAHNAGRSQMAAAFLTHLGLTATLVRLRTLIRRSTSRYHRDGRPTTRRLK
ncbi:hypothetical protein ACFV9E_42625, partial [Streptomyces sp. NPDC059835]